MKKSIMILGVHHLDNPNNGDMYKFNSGNIESEKRQSEIKELIMCLKEFNPTKIALELDTEINEKINTDYTNFLKGTFSLTTNEKHQIGFKLAKELGLNKLYCVNWNKVESHVPNVLQWVSENKCSIWDELSKELADDALETQDYLNNHTIKEFIIKINQDEYTMKNHKTYMKLALISDGANPIGAQWVSKYWYYRNMIIYKNIADLFESDDERILLIIGAAHVHLLKQFFNENGEFNVEDTIGYLTN